MTEPYGTLPAIPAIPAIGWDDHQGWDDHTLATLHDDPTPAIPTTPASRQVLKTLAWLATHDEVWEARGNAGSVASYLDATSLYWRESASDPADSHEAVQRAMARATAVRRLANLRQWREFHDAVDAAATILRNDRGTP
jgi:hypothetical protein